MKTRKLLAVLLCLVMALSTLALSASAATMFEDVLLHSAVYTLDSSVYDEVKSSDVLNQGFISAAGARALYRVQQGFDDELPTELPDASDLIPEIYVKQTVVTNKNILSVEITLKNPAGVAAGDFLLTFNSDKLVLGLTEVNDESVVAVAQAYNMNDLSKMAVSFFCKDELATINSPFVTITISFNILADVPELTDFDIRTLYDVNNADMTANATVTTEKVEITAPETFLDKVIKFFLKIFAWFTNLFTK